MTLAAAVAGCGGGGDDSSLDSIIGSSSSSSVSSSSSSSVSSTPTGNDYVWKEGVYPPADTFWSLCANPREGIAPYNDQPYPDEAGTYIDENVFLRSFSNDYYLWYDEIDDRNPILYDTPTYFGLLKTDELTPTGNAKDQFHWWEETESYRARTESGVSVGYGVQWTLLSATPPREVVVAYSEPDSSAGEQGLMRGARVLSIDGIDMESDDTQEGVDILNAGLFPSTEGETHTFVVQDLGAASPREITLTAGQVAISAVNQTNIIETPTGSVGYLLFNSHIATAEAELVETFDQFVAANVSDVVLDMRYNGGGFLTIASQLAYMIGGNNVEGKTFSETVFNDKHPTFDPFSGQLLDGEPFVTETQNFSLPEGSPLPTLDLNRVYVLTGPNTCSASESVINGLIGADVEVVQIGAETCGKPYGAYVIDNCGRSYFTIQFKGANAKGYGDYTDGFFPGEAGSANQAELPGCSVDDDFNSLLGTETEARLAAALYYRNNGTCPDTEASAKAGPGALQKARKAGASDGVIYHPPGMGDAIKRR